VHAPEDAGAGQRLPPVRVLVADAQPAFRLGVVGILAAAGLRAQPVEGVGVLLAECAAPGSDVAGALVDASLVRSPAVVAELLGRRPGLAVAVVVDRAHAHALGALLAAGAASLVHREATPEQLVAATAAALAGHGWVSPPLAARLRDDLVAEASGQPAARLTGREREVLRALVAGSTNAAIASRLGISENTARNHVQSLMAKLGVASRTDAVTAALRRGLVELG